MIKNNLLTHLMIVGFAVLSAIIPSATHSADAEQTHKFNGDLQNLIPSLYGGDGILLEPSDIFDHSAHFTEDSLVELNKLSQSVQDINFPTLNMQVGASYSYDPVLDEFVKDSSPYGGSIFAEDADTIGRGRYSFGLIYSRQKFKRFEGDSLNNLTIDLNHFDIGSDGNTSPCIGGPPNACYTFEQDVVRLTIDLDLQQEVSAFVGTYGVLERLDLGIVVPVMKTKIKASSVYSIVEDDSQANVPFHVHRIGDQSDPVHSSLKGSHTGVGDIFLRSKYWALRASDGKPLDLSLGLDIRLPTGDSKNLQGISDVGVMPRLIASKRIPLGKGSLQPHFNLSYLVNSGANNEHEVQYNLGTSYAFPIFEDDKYISFSADFLARSTVKNRGDFGNDQYDVALGVNLIPAKRLSLFYNAILPVNKNDGLRSELVNVFGLQMRF